MDAYIDALPPWQADLAQRVRRVVHEADPEVEEVIKRRVQPYFVLQGNVCALLATKHHLDVFIYDPIAPDPHGLVNQGHDNATARGIQIGPDDDLDEEALLEALPSGHRQQPGRAAGARSPGRVERPPPDDPAGGHQWIAGPGPDKPFAGPAPP